MEKYISYDADDFIFDILVKNLDIYKFTNVQPIFGEVHDIEGEILIFPEQDFKRYGTYGFYGIDYNGTKIGRELPTITID